MVSNAPERRFSQSHREFDSSLSHKDLCSKKYLLYPHVRFHLAAGQNLLLCIGMFKVGFRIKKLLGEIIRSGPMTDSRNCSIT